MMTKLAIALHRLALPILLALLVASCDNRAIQASELMEEAETSLKAQDYNRAIEFSISALGLYHDLSDQKGMAKANYFVSRAHALSGNFQQAVEHGEEAAKIIRPLNEFDLEFKINNTLSWSYFELGKGFGETRNHQERQLYVAEQLEDEGAKAMVYNNYSYDATVAGTVPLSKAIEYQKLANDHYTKTEDSDGRWYTLMNLTWQHRLMGDLKASEEYGRKAIERAFKDEDRHAIIEAGTNLGETLIAMDLKEEAQEFYLQAKQHAEEKDDRDTYVFDVYYAKFLWETGQRNEAISRLESATEFLKTGEIFYEMLGRAYLGKYYLETGQIEKAKAQIDVFKQPRASYFSQEAKVIIGLVEAEIRAMEGDSEQSQQMMDDLLRAVRQSEAKWLEERIDEVMK